MSLWFVFGCKQHRVEPGGSCEHDGHCILGRCLSGRCVAKEIFEESLLEQSGVATPAQAESEPRPAAAGTPIRLREARGAPPVFAACAREERLVGGGCSGGEHCVGQGCAYLRSYPSSPDRADTLGGRWHCSGGRGELTAHALCQPAR